MKKKSLTRKAMAKLASMGGKATLKRHGRKHFSKLGKLSGLARKKNGFLIKKGFSISDKILKTGVVGEFKGYRIYRKGKSILKPREKIK